MRLTHAVSGGDYGSETAAGVGVTVIENDTPTLSIADASGVEGSGELLFEVELSQAGSAVVTVDYATADGTAESGVDYTETTGTLTFAAETTGPLTIRVAITDDGADEAEEETFRVELSGESGAALGDASATGTIEDDDDPAVAVRFGAASYAAVEGGSAVVTVELSVDPEREVEIAVTAAGENGADSGDYTVTGATVTFGSGETSKEVTVAAVDDRVDDDGERVTLGLGTPLPDGVTAGSPATAVVTLEDNDKRGVAVEPRELRVTEGGAGESYTVVLETEPTGAVTVAVEVPAGTDVSVSPESLTFTSGNWSEPQTVTVTAAEDEDALADGVVSLTHAVSGGDYGSETAAGVGVTVIENDTPTLSIADASGVEGSGDLLFEVELSQAGSGVVTVDYATADGTAESGADYTETTGTLTFAAETTGPLTIRVAITDDGADEAEEETFRVELSGAVNAGLGDGSATGTIRDDDEANRGPAVVGVLEDRSLAVGDEGVRVEVSGVFRDEEGDELSYSAESSDAGVARVEVSGSTVTVSPVAVGEARVTVRATEVGGSGLSAEASFEVTVRLMVGEVQIEPGAEGVKVVVFAPSEVASVRIEVPTGRDGRSLLDTDGDGDVDGEDGLPTVTAVPAAELPAVPAGLRVRVEESTAVDIELPERGAGAAEVAVRVCLATGLETEDLSLYRYDEDAGEWQALASTVEQREGVRYVCAEVGDFSIFAVFEERGVDAGGADVNGDGGIDADDALVMYYAYALESLLGDGESGGVARFRETLLGGRAGTPGPSDGMLMEMLRRANAWREAGVGAGGDVNGDGGIDADDALVMYYAYALGSLLGDGESGGVARFRQTLLAGRAGSPSPGDADLRAMLQRANALRDSIR